MTQSDADGLQQFSKVLWNSEVWRVTVNVQHRFEDGYEPSDIDSLRLDFRQLLANPTSKQNIDKRVPSPLTSIRVDCGWSEWAKSLPLVAIRVRRCSRSLRDW